MSSLNPSTIQMVATICFVLAVFHTFATKKFAEVSHRFPKGSMPESLFHFLAEVEVVFGVWAFIFVGIMAALTSTDEAVEYLESVSFTEAAFVFVIMSIASTKPVLDAARVTLSKIANFAPTAYKTVFWYAICLTLGPLLGSFITEPAAMTVTALLLLPFVFSSESSSRLRYSTLAVLFVNISIGGTLTHFAAPPVVMVAEKWHWGIEFMFMNFGWKAALAVFINTIIVTAYNIKELLSKAPIVSTRSSTPLWVVAVHLCFLFLVVKYHHSMAFFLPFFLIFLGWFEVSGTYQDQLKLRESLLVGFFLGGLVTLGQLQSWWITPLIESLNSFQLFSGATLLTAFTDNAALTFLGTLVPDLSDNSKYALVAGAVCGGGLTVIANAPNPIGFGLVKQSFGGGSISASKLFLFSLIPTVVACCCLWLF